jgi:hypothetical protein
MPERIFTASNDITIALFAMLAALWGGFVSYFRRIETGMAHSLARLAIHVATSGFAGLMAYLACVAAEAPPAITGICCGIAGHAGTEALRTLEDWFRARLK